MRYQKLKCVQSFKMLTKGLNENEAAVKIQKIWRGYIRRKLYQKLKNSRRNDVDSEDDEVDIDFFNNELERVEFDVDL